MHKNSGDDGPARLPAPPFLSEGDRLVESDAVSFERMRSHVRTVVSSACIGMQLLRPAGRLESPGTFAFRSAVWSRTSSEPGLAVLYPFGVQPGGKSSELELEVVGLIITSILIIYFILYYIYIILYIYYIYIYIYICISCQVLYLEVDFGPWWRALLPRTNNYVI